MIVLHWLAVGSAHTNAVSQFGIYEGLRRILSSVYSRGPFFYQYPYHVPRFAQFVGISNPRCPQAANELEVRYEFGAGHHMPVPFPEMCE
jgi:hypothetical protein